MEQALTNDFCINIQSDKSNRTQHSNRICADKGKGKRCKSEIFVRIFYTQRLQIATGVTQERRKACNSFMAKAVLTFTSFVFDRLVILRLKL